MPAPCFVAWNSATGALTAPPTAQATAAVSGTVRTMLQIAPASTVQLRVIEWGYALNAAPAAPVAIELVETGTIFASGLTAHVAAGIAQINVPTGATSTVQLGAALTGYAAAAPTEGSVVATRLLDFQWENGLYLKKQFPLGREPEIVAGRALRIRATPTSAAAVNLACYIVWEE
jgi:hypothetical protein